MKSLSTNDMKLIAGGGWLGGWRNRLPTLPNRISLLLVGIAASGAHQVGGVISGEEFSFTYLLGSTLASMATTPVLADAGMTHTSLKTAVTLVYATGFHGYVQGLVTQQPYENQDTSDDVETG